MFQKVNTTRGFNMAELRGLNNTREVGKPYTMDGVYVDDIQNYVHSNNDT